MPNRWTTHVKAYAAQHGLTFIEAQKYAGESYEYKSTRTARNAERRMADDKVFPRVPELRVRRGQAHPVAAVAHPAAAVAAPPIPPYPAHPPPPIPVKVKKVAPPLPPKPARVLPPPNLKQTVEALNKCVKEKAVLKQKYKKWKGRVLDEEVFV